jgi:hypothetical protein
MFYVVPEGRSLVRTVSKSKTLDGAIKQAQKVAKETGFDFEVIHHKIVWSTKGETK